MAICFSTGFRKPSTKITLGDVIEIIDILSVKLSIAEIEQFSSSLNELGVLEYIKNYPDLMRDLFVDNGKRLTSGE